MKRLDYYFLTMLLFTLLACNNKKAGSGEQTNTAVAGAAKNDDPAKTLKFACAISNGMKGDSLFFEVSPDRKKLSNLTFKGWWRCSGRISHEQAAGPDGSFDIVNDKVDGVIAEPPGGGSTSWRFELHTTLSGNTATGTFRMNINNLGCDSYLLKFEGTGR